MRLIGDLICASLLAVLAAAPVVFVLRHVLDFPIDDAVRFGAAVGILTLAALGSEAAKSHERNDKTEG